MICEDCGFPLVGATITTTEIATDTDVEAVIQSHVAELETQAVVELNFEGFPVPVALPFEAERIVVGRFDASSPGKPDLDLTPYGAFEKGVSRNHAALVRSEYALAIVDLGSANGTLVNGRRLISNKPHIIHDGDHITFGQMAVSVHFRGSSESSHS
jgi:hypothetical protein